MQESSDGIPVTLGLAAAAGLGIFAFTEVNNIFLFIMFFFGKHH